MRASLLAGPALLIVLAGCSPGTGNVSGTVSCGSVPVSSGWVVIVGSDARPCYGAIAEDGKFMVQGVCVGLATVAVSSPDPRGRGPRINKPVSASLEGTAVKKWFPLPDRYADHEQSGMRLTVKRGENTLDLPLEKPVDQ